MMPGFKTIEFTIHRTIPATPGEVYDAWMDPENPGSAWYGIEKLILDPRVDGLFYRMHLKGDREVPHFGRFVVLDRPRRIQHTWMSPNTRGLESVVTVAFAAKGEDTELTLRHTNLPDDEMGRAHEQGWGQYIDNLLANFSRKHP